MKTALVGVTGFVGGNIAASHFFDNTYHSTDVENAYGTSPDLLIYAGLPAAKYLANQNSAADMQLCEQALNNIKKIGAKRTVLISTVDVYHSANGPDENTIPEPDKLAPYGKNRAILEKSAAECCKDLLIVRLPGLFGAGLKKNFLYDFLTIIPAMLTKEKYAELSAKSSLVLNGYEDKQNGFFALKNLDGKEKSLLKAFFETNDFNALSFTDSRAVFQFYDLSQLWKDLVWMLEANLKIVNIATEPLSAGEIYERLTYGKAFKNELDKPVPYYDMHCKYANLFGGEGFYINTKEEVLDKICAFKSAFCARDCNE